MDGQSQNARHFFEGKKEWLHFKEGGFAFDVCKELQCDIAHVTFDDIFVYQHC